MLARFAVAKLLINSRSERSKIGSFNRYHGARRTLSIPENFLTLSLVDEKEDWGLGPVELTLSAF